MILEVRIMVTFGGISARGQGRSQGKGNALFLRLVMSMCSRGKLVIYVPFGMHVILQWKTQIFF